MGSRFRHEDQRTLLAPEMGHAGAGAGAMLVACRLAGLSALEAYYAGVRARAQFGPRLAWSPRPDLYCAPKTAENGRDAGRAPEDPRPTF